MINSDKKDGRKSMLRRVSRKIWPWDAFWKTRKPPRGQMPNISNPLLPPRRGLIKTNMFGSLSAPLLRRTSNKKLGSSTISNKRTGGMSSTLALRIFSAEELKAATRNFHSDTFVGEGGFGSVYKGWIHEESSAEKGSGFMVAVKKLNHESMQGFQEWQTEVIFLGKLSHPNLVNLLGYGWEWDEKVLFLVYEFMQKGSLENHLFGWSLQPLSWDIRLKILTGAAHGLAFLHSSEIKVIHRDFKSSNILLDESYHAKISDFGLAKTDPLDLTHVSTQVIGTYGYASPEYMATGHSTTKSDVYGFGVVLLEMLTGLRVLDKNRPSGKRNLVDWMKPRLSDRRKLNKIIDPRMEGRYSPSSAAQLAKLALNCLDIYPKRRSTMQQVVETLESMDTSPDKPRVHFSTQQPV